MTKESQLVLDKLTEYVSTVPKSTLDKIEYVKSYNEFLSDAKDYLLEHNNSLNAFNTVIKSIKFLNKKNILIYEDYKNMVDELAKIYIGTTVANELRKIFIKGF